MTEKPNGSLNRKIGENTSMLRSLFSGVAGLKAHQTRMDVIGNNIANVNTYGFKSSRTTFRDMYYQTISASSSASGTRSGSNASQVGYGSSVASVDVLNTRTGFASTGNSMDLYIDGEGYFVVRDGAGNEHLTQVGTFGFDGDGNLTDGAGNFVCGYSVQSLTNQASIGGVTIDFGAVNTTGDNPKSLLAGFTVKVKYDSSDSAAAKVEADGKEKTITITLPKVNDDPTSTDVDETKFPTQTDLKDALNAAWTWTNETVKVDGEDYKLSDLVNVASVKVPGAESDATKDTVVKETTGKIAEAAIFEGQDAEDKSNYIKKIINTKGEMKNISVGTDGTITGEDIDGTIQIIGKIALANVPNPDALQREGNSYYKAVNNTGAITYTAPGENNTGALRSGGLESSNVDLANEFSDMIMTQRGFQASSKMITVSDEMLETLVNLKR